MTDARAFFDAIAPRYDRAYARSGREVRERLAALALPPGRVLDLGVGTGAELPFLFDAGHEVVGVDVSERMIELCRRRTRVPDLVRADFYAPLPFPDASFACAIALFGALAHPPDRGAHARLGRELSRVLAPGGVFAAEMPAPSWDGRVHVDEEAGARIVVRAPSEAAWRRALSGWEVAVRARGADEIEIRARNRPARAAP